MKRLDAIIALCTGLDGMLDLERGSGDEATSSRGVARQVLNDHACVLPCWEQSKIEINKKCRATIRRRPVRADWPIRHGWDLSNPENKRLSGLSFFDRATLLLDRAAGRSRAYARTRAQHDARNQFANGALNKPGSMAWRSLRTRMRVKLPCTEASEA